MFTALKILLILLGAGLVLAVIGFFLKIRLNGPGGYKSKGPRDPKKDQH